jgi:hypothetical protein
MHFSLVLCFLLSALFGGCADPGAAETSEEGEDSPSAAGAAKVDSIEQAVWGGTEVNRRGIVALRTSAGDCTGILINWYSVLTAGHCVPQIAPGTDGPLDVSVVYRRPAGNLECLSGGAVTARPGEQPKCNTRGQYQVFSFPGRTSGDAARDLAVIVSPRTFAAVSESDYAYIDIESMTSLSRAEFYGYGPNSYQGTGAGILRVGSGPIQGVATGHFNLTAGGARSCRGDSGGPATIPFATTSGRLQVLGLASNGELSESGRCVTEGGTERFVRLSNKLPFIEDAIDRACGQTTLGGRRVRRCF